ncbi:MAG: hypothetical protein ACR2H5_10590 [Ktedonobacteraceae bacterium]
MFADDTMVTARATARDRPYYIRLPFPTGNGSQSRLVYSRGDPLRSPWWGYEPLLPVAAKALPSC